MKVLAHRHGKKRPATSVSYTRSTHKAHVALEPNSRNPYLSRNASFFDVSAHKFELMPSQPAMTSEPAYEYLGELPESYGTKRLYLVARDPQWLFAYWDWTLPQFQEAANAAHEHKVFLQIYSATGDRLQQIRVREESRHWYIHIGMPASTFYAELGYYRHDGEFVVMARSSHATTPQDNILWKTETHFVTIPMDYTFQQLHELIQDHMHPGEALGEALARLQQNGFKFPFPINIGRGLNQTQHDQMLEYLAGNYQKRNGGGSLEITEMLRRRIHESQSSGVFPTSGGVTSMSSPFGASFGAGSERGFYIHVNAELIIYGGTDPNASLRIDGKDIQLREDGTFSYHFSFPNGHFHIPIEAVSPDKKECRSAMLSFLRESHYSGDVQSTVQPLLPAPFGRISEHGNGAGVNQVNSEYCLA